MQTPTPAPAPPPVGVRGVLARHPLVAFFALAFGLSWLAWLPYLLSENGLGVLAFSFPSVLGTSQLLGVLPGAYLGPVTAAVVVTVLVEGRAGLRAWRGRLLRFRVGARWYLGVGVLVPLSLLAATFVLPQAWGSARMVGAGLLLAYVPMLVLQVVTTALAEEPGWRDFALPRLQARLGPVTGTVVLGLLWGAWHWPLFLTEWGGHPDVTWVQPVLFTASCVPLSLVMTWVFNRTGQSVPLVMLLHAGINSTYTLLWPAFFPALHGDHDVLVVQLAATTVASAVLMIATRGRLGAPDTPVLDGARPERPARAARPPR
ncbi:CPBP family intramembrane metalloprotease [Modestobacter sp. I12A-02628]|uniref:CPBP family intramembrane metalloprotease n=1 Tax=Goekera deserti TaxID=2497753 RepID=A0A7K3WGR9_9ACTN|nr:CPBP family intramembrane metalloprotease [Goekera deserti]NDI50364.1 CPBP family intramembrane metalloprotease [Goekera deserti]NEL55678.1 CPBP family intramembrane metalloprotease [Goekera deserti]